MTSSERGAGLTPSGGRGLFLVLALALVLRLATALLWAPEPVADAADYERLARGLVAGDGFVNPSGEPTSWRPPLYPAAVAVVYGTVGESRTAVRVLQAVVSTGSVALVFALGWTLLGPGPALVAAAFAALDPAAVSGVSRLLTESLFTFLLLATTLALVRARGRRSSPSPPGAAPDVDAAPGARAPLAWALAGGLLLGLGALTRGVLVLYPLALVPLWLLDRRASRRGLALLLLGFALALAPWTIRNARVHDAFVPVATQGGMTLYSGNHPVDGWKFGFVPSDETTREAEALTETEASGALVRATARDLAASPGSVPRLLALKAAFFWVPLDWELMPWSGVLNPVYLVVLLWAVWWALRVGAAAVRKTGAPAARPLGAWPYWLPVAYFFALALVFYGSPRFRLPVEPFLALAAAAGLADLARRHGRRVAAAGLGVSATAAVLLAVLAEPLKGLLRSVLGV